MATYASKSVKTLLPFGVWKSCRGSTFEKYTEFMASNKNSDYIEQSEHSEIASTHTHTMWHWESERKRNSTIAEVNRNICGTFLVGDMFLPEILSLACSRSL